MIDNKLLKKSELKNIMIAYEPVWAIGTGKVPEVSEINENISFINIKKVVNLTLPENRTGCRYYFQRYGFDGKAISEI